MNLGLKRDVTVTDVNQGVDLMAYAAMGLEAVPWGVHEDRGTRLRTGALQTSESCEGDTTPVEESKKCQSIK